MIPFTLHSQALQDRFVYELLVKPDNLLRGSFLDIGACHPIEISNTYALEQLGWRGLLIDNDPGAIELCCRFRKSTSMLADATKVDWAYLLDTTHLNSPVDYLSLDVDAASLPTLYRLPLDRLKFRVITIEHDSYRFGTLISDAMRLVLRNAGYDLVCADVCSAEGLPYEDWWVAPELSRRADPFRCEHKKWTEIFPT